jgi:hypothetical protein
MLSVSGILFVGVAEILGLQFMLLAGILVSYVITSETFFVWNLCLQMSSLLL